MTDDIERRRFLKASSAAITGAVGATAASGTAAAHAVSTALYTTTDLSVREGPGLNYNRIAVADQYTGGHIVDGPVDSDGYTWWKITYNEDSNNGPVTGWSVQQYTAHADFAYPANGVVTQEYQSGHAALDIANSDDPTYIHAAQDGTVDVVDNYDNSDCGHYVKLYHGNGWRTLYCHMDDIYVSEGESVSQDEHIGTMGDTGHSTGQHVHFAIRQYGDPYLVPGFKYQDIRSKTGVPKNYPDI